VKLVIGRQLDAVLLIALSKAEHCYSQESLPDLPSLSLWLQEIGKSRAAGNN
jgi:hypothetical protein